LGTAERETSPRQFFWHFPHYNNQGGRPAGATRSGNWKYIQYYDTGEFELFNVRDDVGETKNLAASETKLAEYFGRQHALWLDDIGAQRNTPNPDFDAALFKKLYQDFDPSRPILRKTAAEMERDMQAWRQLMNDVVAPAGGKKKKQ
jgi:hypothetical protein